MKRLLISVLIVFIAGSPLAHAEEGGGSPAPKTPPNRWSLDEWLKQKQRTRLMDQWLSIHESSPYEFFLGADGTSIAASSDATGSSQQIVNNAYRASVGAYASIVGLEGIYENLTDLHSTSSEGSFHVRLLGTSVRSTSLEAHYALKYRDENGEHVRLAAPGGRLTILITKNFGLTGSYDQHLEGTSDTGQKWSGSQTEGEVFIDFERLRVFGRYTKRDDQITSTSGSVEKRLREGLGGGIKIYF